MRDELYRHILRLPLQFFRQTQPGTVMTSLMAELGAVDKDRRLTPIGRQMLRLPVDVKLARMLIAAQHLGCLREVTVLAAFLGIQDPRERPLDRQEQADTAHRRFAHPDSDFLGPLFD